MLVCTNLHDNSLQDQNLQETLFKSCTLCCSIMTEYLFVLFDDMSYDKAIRNYLFTVNTTFIDVSN